MAILQKRFLKVIMGYISIVFIAIGLSMDALAVAISSSLSLGRITARQALRIATAFGGFQALMPVLGWLAGSQMQKWIRAFDHWIAFGLLFLIGLKMIHEACGEHGSRKDIDVSKWHVLLALAVATSIDALVIGLSFAFLNTPILTPALIIGSITFVISLVGVGLGQKLGCHLGGKMEMLGGAVLICIGLKILISHLFFNG